MKTQMQNQSAKIVAHKTKLDFSWVIGGLAAVAFYLVLPSIPLDENFKYRYFNSHWIEHCTVTLFFIGLAILGRKLLNWPSERGVLSENILEGIKFDPQSDSSVVAQLMREHIQLTGRRYQSTELFRRIETVCGYVISRHTAADLESHLSYLADTAMARLHSSYAALRTITWAIPILGFLGTVIGITMAIANVTPEQLESSLNEVTSGLAVAFDTTALSLALSMILVFATFAIERGESNVLDQIEDFTVHRLLGFFPVEKSSEVSPLLAAEHDVARRFLDQADILTRQHLEAWNNTVSRCREQWASLATEQGHSLAVALSAAMGEALSTQQQLMQETQAESRREVEAMQASFAENLSLMQHQLAESVRSQLELMHQSWQSASEAQASIQNQFTSSLAGAIDAVQENVSTLAGSLQEVGTHSLAQAEALERQTIQISSLVGSSQQLIQAESLLAENLATLKQTQTLEETLLNLNAAVHLLSARAHHRAA